MKLLKQSSISLHPLKNTRGQRVGQRHNEREPGQRHSNKNTKPELNERQIDLLETGKMTERMASGVDDQFGMDTGS